MESLARLMGGAAVFKESQGGTMMMQWGATEPAWAGREYREVDGEGTMAGCVIYEIAGCDIYEMASCDICKMAGYDICELAAYDTGEYDGDTEANADELLETADTHVAVGSVVGDTCAGQLLGAVVIGAVAYMAYKRLLRFGA